MDEVVTLRRDSTIKLISSNIGGLTIPEYLEILCGLSLIVFLTFFISVGAEPSIAEFVNMYYLETFGGGTKLQYMFEPDNID